MKTFITKPLRVGVIKRIMSDRIRFLKRTVKPLLGIKYPNLKKILIVDDESFCVQVIQRFLNTEAIQSDSSFFPSEVKNKSFLITLQGLAKIKDNHEEYSCVLIDTHMAGMDGYTLATKIRQYESIPTNHFHQYNRKHGIRQIKFDFIKWRGVTHT